MLASENVQEVAAMALSEQSSRTAIWSHGLKIRIVTLAIFNAAPGDP